MTRSHAALGREITIASPGAGGRGIALVGSLGLLRLPTHFERACTPAIIATLGMWCIMHACIVYFSPSAPPGPASVADRAVRRRDGADHQYLPDACRPVPCTPGGQAMPPASAATRACLTPDSIAASACCIRAVRPSHYFQEPPTPSRMRSRAMLNILSICLRGLCRRCICQGPGAAGWVLPTGLLPWGHAGSHTWLAVATRSACVAVFQAMPTLTLRRLAPGPRDGFPLGALTAFSSASSAEAVGLLQQQRLGLALGVAALRPDGLAAADLAGPAQRRARQLLRSL